MKHRILITTICFFILGCPDKPNNIEPPGIDRQLTIPDPLGPDVGLLLGAQQKIGVTYEFINGEPIAGAQIHFAIFGDPQGSTLSSDIALTDVNGFASVELRAGSAVTNFQIHVSAQNADTKIFYIEVSNAGFGSFQATSQYLGIVPLKEFTKVRFLLYVDISCQSIQATSPPLAFREHETSAVGKSVKFTARPVDINHSILVLVQDSTNRLRASGCLELPNTLLKPNQEIIFVVPTQDLQLQIAGTYTLKTQVILSDVIAPLLDITKPWTDLIDCNNDPAQLMLDCVLDAIDDQDPLDCVIENPSAKTTTLLATRGAFNGTCRSDLTEHNTPSIDALIYEQINESSSAILTALSTLESYVVPSLTEFQIESSLSIGPLSFLGQAIATHQLDSVTFFAPSDQVTYKTSEFGLPEPLASTIQINVLGEQIKIEEHGFTLRFGLLTKNVVEDLVLPAVQLPSSISDFSSALFNLVSKDGLQGCSAIDAIICEAALMPQGCTGNACSSSLNAMISYLESKMFALDNPSTDLLLKGEADLISNPGTLFVEHIGSSTIPGLWTKFEITMGDEIVTPLESSFVGQRE